ncbi:MAG: hypothetical protein KIT00_12235, partial [Rhodospirillales bacterium]|nr:hypothetical protein [Rhodospirillales bacterium]
MVKEKARWRRRAFFFVGLLSLAACSPWIVGYGFRDQADKLALDAGMVKTRIPAGQFVLTAYHRLRVCSGIS